MRGTTLSTLVASLVAGNAQAQDYTKRICSVADGCIPAAVVRVNAETTAEHPTGTYTDGVGYVGYAAGIKGEAETQDVVAYGNMVFLQFPTLNEELQPVKPGGSGVRHGSLTIYPTSGTCWSSKDKTICNRPLEVQVYALTEPIEDFKSINWEAAQTVDLTKPFLHLGSTFVRRPYGNEKREGVNIPLFLGAARANYPTIYGLVVVSPISGANDAELWANQTDMTFDTKASRLKLY